MTRDDLMQMAEKSGLEEWCRGESSDDDFFGRFANLVAEKEREACAQIGEAFDKERPQTNYGRCIAVAIRARGQK